MIVLLLVVGCAAKPAHTVAPPTPAVCAADACVYGEPFSDDELLVWADLWHLEDARAPSLILLARAHECRARGVAISDEELVAYIRSGALLGELGEPGEFDATRYARTVKIKYRLTLSRYEELRRREAVVARCNLPALWPGWPRRPPLSLPRLDDDLERLRARGALGGR